MQQNRHLKRNMPVMEGLVVTANVTAAVVSFNENHGQIMECQKIFKAPFKSVHYLVIWRKSSKSVQWPNHFLSQPEAKISTTEQYTCLSILLATLIIEFVARAVPAGLIIGQMRRQMRDGIFFSTPLNIRGRMMKSIM